MAELDPHFALPILAIRKSSREWLLMSIAADIEPRIRNWTGFLIEVGRRKYIKPLYQELAKTPEGKSSCEGSLCEGAARAIIRSRSQRSMIS